MSCILAAPQWDDNNQVGLTSAVENIANNAR